jgi:hypothetical protein
MVHTAQQHMGEEGYGCGVPARGVIAGHSSGGANGRYSKGQEPSPRASDKRR